MNIEKRLKRLENRDGFKNERERQDYIQYAQMLDESIQPDDIQNPDDYIELAKQHFEPL